MDILKALVAALREQRPTRTVSVVQRDYDPTFGARETTRDIEVVDFDALMDAIDEFSASFKEPQ